MWILLTYKNCSNESENAPDCIDFGLFFKKISGRGGACPRTLHSRCACHVGFADAPLTVPQGRTFLFFLSNQLQAMHYGSGFCLVAPLKTKNPTTEVVRIHLCEWCILGVFLWLAFTHLGHEGQDI